MSQVIEVATGLILVYYVLGLIVSFVINRINESLQKRGSDLEGYLKRIVGDAQLKDLLNQPQIRSLAPVRYKGWKGAITGKLSEQKIEKIPVANLVDSLFTMIRLSEKEYTAKEVKEIIAKMPESEFKKNLQLFVGQKVADIEQLRSKTAMWVGGVMEQAAATYKAHARQYAIGLSLFVTLIFGVDSIELAAQLWRSADYRAFVNATADTYVGEEVEESNVATYLKDIEDITARVGWWALPDNLPEEATPMEWALWVAAKIAGLAITFAAVCQGSSFWYDVLKRVKGENSATLKGSKKESVPA